MGEAGPAATGNGPSGPRAGFWRRFAGALIDGILLGIVSGILRVVLGTGGGTGLGIVVSAVYVTWLIGRPAGQTLGQMALGIRVIDFAAGGQIGYPRAFVRWIVAYVSAIPIFLGYFWMLWDKEKQTWFDKASNSVVVPTSAYPVYS